MALHLDVAAFVGGLVLLTAGAEVLVRGASRLAAAFRIPPLVVGLTVVAFGTSAPELVVSVAAALEGRGAIAIGNVVGSNIFNVLVALGAAALVAPLPVEARVVRREVPIMIAASLLLVLLLLDGTIGRLEGALLVLLLVVVVVAGYRASREEPPAVQAEFAEEFAPPPRRRVALDVGFVVVGLLGLVVGGRLVVGGAVDIARAAGVTERIIALTLIAAGTSLPELATTLLAAFRRHVDIAVGNAVGSSVFNILGILGVASLVAPLAAPAEVLAFDLPVMVVVALATLPIVRSHHRVSRAEGAVLLVAYVGYIGALVALAGA